MNKIIVGNYIVGTSENYGIPMTDEEEANYKMALANKPNAIEGKIHKLTTSLEWIAEDALVYDEQTDNITLDEYNDALQTVADYEAQEGGGTP